ncbi:MAG: rod shape-determining protein MreC [Lentilactobacillus hilgardii]|uniref:rod shape-determining protein MreC n=1 Tax=Lentilactobacillus hilgardii TaxID=1588 RepID=UPI001CC209BB|nr:rod shape-determining protein MreC [Lentilactobacillus hilgardii]MCI1922714.1 rod shape-determining protein MreC [Lentilactobacillus buchneri]MBZ2201404.1 rod shape-determining protein MreC [Lentilactobacillus hilgardii]MBZ2204319.1 rod shape-determining protein MreC [Lentilactobacillus hilgardii]MCI1950324.1 rod shape-determining protein MreC [Lentilactobacillus buchneri]MCI2018334.1 rod shape-determining protein MreC [Lentilactobacillus buchneri]
MKRMEAIMQKFFSSRKLVIVIVCLIISFGLMSVSVAFRNNRNTPPLVQQFGNDIVGFADRVVAVPMNGIHHGFISINNLLNTYQENQKLKSKVDQLAQTQVKDQVLERENKQLKRQLNVGSTLTGYEKINAAVITRTPSSWASQIIINKGQAAGVKKNMPVIAGPGLIGTVAEVNKTNSKVVLISNTAENSNRFAIQIVGEGSKIVNGIITSYDSQSNRIIMGNITSKAKLSKGDRVTTSGLGGIIPKGIYVGTVSKISEDDYGLAKKVYIKPAANLNDIEVVSVAVRN